MSEGAIFLNSGPLFNAERLETIEDVTEWGELGDDVRVAYTMIREAFEKHATLLAGSPTVDETRYFMVTPTLHALGFMATVDERLESPGQAGTRFDYTMFDDPEDFREAESLRGSLGFFRNAVGIVSTVKWGTGLDDVPEDAGEGALNPGQRLDVLLRTTGVDYGILTNGCDWRLYHRGTSGQQSTFFQADMIAAVKSDFEDFKRFYVLFRCAGFAKDDSGESFVDRLLQ
ncbi:MAG: hypothetical protein H6700_11495 [Myxococcales bacterium]|nr:hypothetical protein [Myxococcales bacterium]